MKNIIYKIVLKMNRKKIIITTAILINMLMCSCGSESNNIGDSELKAETIADNEVAESEIITKEIAEESIKSIISEESDKSDFVISKNILISYKGCDSHVIIPDGVKKIADGAFWSVDYIEAVEIPGSVEEIGNGAFWSCAGLKYINVAEGLKTIGDTAFWSCPSLKDVNLPNSVSKIYDASFANCSEVTIHAPEGSYAEEYAYNRRLSSDNIFAEYNDSSNENVIRAAQYQYEEFTKFEIADDITAIEANAFQYCKSLKFIDIPSSVKRIGGDAFEYCESLKFVNISEGCVEIGDGTFEYCRSLKDVNIPASVEKIRDSSFDYCDEDLVIHTPKGSYAEKYAKANNIKFDNNLIEN